MQTLLLVLSSLLAYVHSICSGSLYWDPFNNACVNQCPWQPPVLYYADSSTNQCVETCPTTPSYYANDFTQSCTGSKKLINSACPYNTTIKTYYDNYFRRCVLICPSAPSYYAFDGTTDGTCVKYCPSGTFSLDANRTCTVTCPVYHFVNYTLSIVHYQCVAVCPKDTYLSATYCINATSCPAGQYGDPLNGICTTNCPGNGTTQLFADTNTNVKKCVYICPSGFYRQNITTNRTCVDLCLPNSFIDHVGLICVDTCPNGSYSYVNGSCISHCPSGFYADEALHKCHTVCSNSKFRDDLNRFCVALCPPGYFGDTNGDYTCRLTCSLATEYGNPVSRLCVVKANCPSPYNYADDYSRQCVTQCPQSQNTFGDLINNFCTGTCPFAAGGYYFKDPSTQKCVTNCPSNPAYFADNSTKTCVEICPNTFFSVVSTRTCETSCPSNFYRNNVTRQCVSTCPTDPVNTFYYSANSTSSECLTVCPGVLLADPTTMSCISVLCPSLPALFAHNNTCISQCPSGHFAHPLLRECLTGCNGTYLMDNSTWRCVLICPTNPDYYADWATNMCVPYCPPNHFADNSTRQCLTTCNQTVGYLAYTPLRLCVLVCPNNTYSHLGECLTVCPNSTIPHYYIDTTTKSCVSSCPDYYFRDTFLGQCVQVGGCSNGYYADETVRTCLENCTSTNTTYKDNSTMSCVSHCPFGYFGDYSVTTNKQCVTACPAGWLSDNSTWTCVQTCPTYPSYYADLTSQTCLSACRIELDLYAYDGSNNRTCVNPCPNGTFADIYTRRCLINCLLEPNTYEYVNGTERVCVLTCPIGQFADNSTRKCVTNCPASPNYFADWLSATCVSVCPQTATTKYFADPDSRSCVQICPNLTNGTTTYRDTVLRICTQICSGNQFADDSTGDCVDQCPSVPDLFGQMSTKTCVTGCNASEHTWAQNITRLCIQECPAESYSDNLTQRCVAICPVSELTYGDNSTHKCVKRCPILPSLYADNSSQTCVVMCSGYTYAAPITRVCERPTNCSLNYFADNFTKTCVTNCPATQAAYAQNTTQRCLRRCPDGSFADNSTYQCVLVCPSSPSYFGYNKLCLDACPTNTYADSPTRLCVTSMNCTNSTWGDPTSQQCVATCPFNYYADQLNDSKLCVQTCPINYYADDLTKSCVSICPVSNNTYGTNATRRCVEVCPITQFAQNTTRMCMSNCPNGSFADENVKVCVAVCSATPNLYGNPTDNTCVDICPSIPDLYAENSTRLCTATCPLNQSTFADVLTRRCVLTCPVSEFTYADMYTRRCQFNCTYNTSVNVTTFADNSTLTCVAQCPALPEYYGDISTGTGLCVPDCPNATVPRIFSDNSTRLCVPICPVANFFFSANSTGRCMVLCPGGYFADSQTQSCVARCPGRYMMANTTIIDTFGYELDRTCTSFCVSPFFSQNSSRLCIYGCPQLEYADSLLRRCVAACDGQKRQYADNSTNKCVGICPDKPDTFADNSSYSCVSPCPITTGVAYNCINSCPLGTWACNLTRQCVTRCGTTSPNQYADNYTGRCTLNCPANLNTYADNLSLSCVSRCPDANASIPWSMTFADDSTKTCVTVCPSNPWTYAENTTLGCVFRCPNNSFGQNTTRQCVQNCTFWGTFADNSTTFCVSTCPQNSFAQNSSKRCVAQCPPGSYADNSTWRCVIRCPQNPALYGDVLSAVCVINCPNSYYGDDSSRTCVLKCPLTPSIFFAYDPTTRCLENCLYPYFGQPNSTYSTVYGTCQTYCFIGQYKNMTTHRCQQCKLQCTQCASLLGCTSCISGYYLYNGTCMTGCASGSGSSCISACPINIITSVITYADAVSRACVEICPIKSNGGSYGYNLTSYCIDVCPLSYYASNVTRRCQLCVNGCINCTSSTVCFNCDSNHIFSNSLCIKSCSSTLKFYFGTTCVASCIDGTYLMSDQITCGLCSAICSTCSLIASNCTKCIGAYLYNFNCVSQCPNNYYADSNLSCRPCTASVAQCNVAPLTYTLKTFNTNGDLFGILTFNRAVSMDTARIKQILNISIAGLSANQYTWTTNQVNSTSYRITIQTSVSLNQLSLTVVFINPALVIDSAGASLSTTSIVAPLPTYDYISPDAQAATESVSTLSSVLSWISLAIMFVLIFKGSYTLLLITEVFQMVYFHYFMNQTLPYNFSNFLLNLKYLNFQFLPNPMSSTIPNNFISPATPTTYILAVTDISFFISCGHYFIVLAFYAGWALLIVLLKNRTLNKWDRLRRFCRTVFQRRIKFGVINEAFWFCYISFVFFGIWQFKDLQTTTGWNIANVVFAFIFMLLCLMVTVWVVYLSVKYRKDVTKVPKKHQFILGQDSHIPFEIALRHVRKLFFCVFLAIGKIETQIMAIMATNFIVLAYYLFYKPAKSRISNWVNILIEICYIGLEITLLSFVNQVSPTTDQKLNFGKIMMGFAISALLLIVLWMVWQFLFFLYDFKFVRDIIEETKLANQVHPEDDNLKVELDRQYEKDEIIPQDEISQGSHQMQEQTIQGIEKQYNEVVHYVDEKDISPKKQRKIRRNEEISSVSNDPRLISSRGSSRMLFADLNVEDLE